MEESGAALRASKRGKAHILALNCNVAASSVGDDSPTGAFTDKAKAPTATGNSTVPLSDNLSVGAVSIGSMNMVKIAAPPKSRRPMDSPFMQQRIRSYIILLTPGLAIVFFTCIAALCLTVGILLRNSAESIHTSSITYEGKYSSKSGCEVTNRVRMYSISIVIPLPFRGTTYACVVHLYLKLFWMKTTVLCVCESHDDYKTDDLNKQL